jgi:hypothetical protein
MLNDTDAACVGIVLAFRVKMKKKGKRKPSEPVPLFFRIVYFHSLPKIRAERIAFFGYVLSVCVWVSVWIFVKQNCTCILFFS